MKKLLIFIGIIIGILVTAWLTFPYYAQSFLNSLFHEQGIVFQKLEFKAHQLGKLQLNTIQLAKIESDQKVFAVEATDLVAEYTFFPFHIEDLSIGEFSLLANLDKPQTSNNNNSTYLSSPKTQNSRPDPGASFRLEQLPFNKVLIDRLLFKTGSGFNFPIITKLSVKRHNEKLIAKISDTLLSTNRLDLELEQQERNLSAKYDAQWDFSPHAFTLSLLLKQAAPMIKLGKDLPLSIKLSGRANLGSLLDAQGNWSFTHPQIEMTQDTLVAWSVRKNRLSGSFKKDTQLLTVGFKDGAALHADINTPLPGLSESTNEQKSQLQVFTENFALNLKSGKVRSSGKLNQRLSIISSESENEEIGPNIEVGMNILESIHWDSQSTFGFTSSGNLDMAVLDTPETVSIAGQLNYEFSPLFEASDKDLQLSFAQEASVNIAKLAVDTEEQNIRIEQLTATLSPTIIIAPSVDKNSSTNSLNEELTTFGDYKLIVNTPEIKSKKNAEVEKFQLVPSLTAEGNWKGEKNQVALQHRISIIDSNTVITMPMTWNDLEKKLKGSFEINSDNDFIETLIIKDYFPQYADIVTEKSGRLLLSGKFNADLSKQLPVFSASGLMGIEGLNLEFNESRIKDFNAPMTFNIESEALKVEGDVSMKEFFAQEKLKFNDFESKIAIDNKGISVKGTRLKGVSTTFFLDDFSSSFQPFGFESKLRFSGVPMQELVKVADVDALKIEGRLSGALPIRFKDNQFLIDDGVLKADEKGIITYRPEGKLETVCFDLKNISNLQKYALQNFFYEQLEMQVRYDGKMALSLPLVLKGKNPNFCSGREIVLNLNLNYELPEKLWVYFLFGEDFLQKLQEVE